MKSARHRLAVALVLTCLSWLSSCSKETPRQEAQRPTTASQAAAQPAAQSSAPAQSGSSAAATQPEAASSAPGAAATEKHQLNLANYSGAAVTVTLNGTWIGQWDTHATVPLESVVQGKNQLVVELADEPKNTVTLEVNAQRGGNWVNLLRLNFQGKAKATYTYSFFAK